MGPLRIDPEAARRLQGKPLGADLASAGPIAVDEEWSRLRSDSGWHAALWVTEWPRLSVVAGFLWPLILAPQVRRSLSIVLEPVPTAKALKEGPPSGSSTCQIRSPATGGARSPTTRPCRNSPT